MQLSTNQNVWTPVEERMLVVKINLAASRACPWENYGEVVASFRQSPSPEMEDTNTLCICVYYLSMRLVSETEKMGKSSKQVQA